MTQPLHLLDVNVLVALSRSDHVHHSAAQAWFARTPTPRVATCALTESAYLRLMLRPAVAGRAHRVADVLALLSELRSMRGFRFLADPTSLSQPLIDLSGLRGPQQVTDLHLVNLAASSDAVLATFDRRLLDALVPADRHLVAVIPPV